MHLECRPFRVGSSRGAEEAECNREYRILFCDVHHYRLCWPSLLGESVGGVFSSCLFLHLHGRHHQPAGLDGLGHPREAIVSPSKLLLSSTLLSKFSIYLQHFFSTFTINMAKGRYHEIVSSSGMGFTMENWTWILCGHGPCTDMQAAGLSTDGCFVTILFMYALLHNSVLW